MEATLLTEDQILGENALEVIKTYGSRVGLSDLAVLQGGAMSSEYINIEGKRAGMAMSASSLQQGRICGVEFDGKRNAGISADRRDLAIRPALPPSVTSQLQPEEVKGLTCRGRQIKVAVYGEYPQTVASPEIVAELNERRRALTQEVFEEIQKRNGNPIPEGFVFVNDFKKTGKKYIFDAYNPKGTQGDFYPSECFELEYKDKRYILVEGRSADEHSVLSDGKNVITGSPYWVEVRPIEWLMDESGWWVAKEALFSNIRFNPPSFDNSNFNNTEIKRYLDNYFVPEMKPSRSYNVQTHSYNKIDSGAQTVDVSAVSQRKVRRKSAYRVQVVQEPMSVKEQINFYVQNGLSFMLHGPSGVGKTARVEQIDPDLTAVPLWNGVLPEDIVGKVRYPSGTERLPEEFVELIKDVQGDKADKLKALMSSREREEGGVWVAPDWYTELCKKCAAEPNKQHVLFIDEVTNARPTTQSLIFHIVLKKSISPSKGKLPKNAVVVLAGNSKEESGAAYNMPEPLYRRMSSHIHLQPDLLEWLEWGSQASLKHPEDKDRLNIHPLISAFVSSQGLDVFYTPYDEEEPPEFAMDPRGWEQVSDIIYNNKGVIRRELLLGKIGTELTENLMAYAANPPLSLEDVLEGAYDKSNLPTGNDERLALVYNLRRADEEQVKTVRAFIGKNLGPEYQQVYDSIWVGEDDDRALYINSLAAYKGRGR